MNKSILSQIKQAKEQIEKTEIQLKQFENQKQNIITRNRNEEQKARTRRLIQRGAILENINPLIIGLSNEELKIYLTEVLGTAYATTLLEIATQPISAE